MTSPARQLHVPRKSVMVATVTVRKTDLDVYYTVDGLDMAATADDDAECVTCRVVRVELEGVDVTRLCERDMDTIEEELDMQWLGETE